MSLLTVGIVSLVLLVKNLEISDIELWLNLRLRESFHLESTCRFESQPYIKTSQ
jgi:hypothetical protein